MQFWQWPMRFVVAEKILARSFTGVHCELCFGSQGKSVVLAGLKALNGQLEFFNVDDFETLATNEHFMCQEVEWDPTGRYVATSVTSVVSMENGFHMWAFNGKLLYKTLRDRFFKVCSHRQACNAQA